MHYIAKIIFCMVLGIHLYTHTVHAKTIHSNGTQKNYDTKMLVLRKQLYDKIENLSHVPWYKLAAIDQYERTLCTTSIQNRNVCNRWSKISIPSTVWAGLFNPDPTDRHPQSIAWFGGFGSDGSGDGIADPNNDEDCLYTMARIIQQYGPRNEDFELAMWEHYHNCRAVQRIKQFCKLYKQLNTLDLYRNTFPVSIKNDYSYRSTWGVKRNWGGRRSHEGTDLFVCYGVPVVSCCYGVVEMKGWNRFGGWRVGIRDIRNHYHYYAHLSRFHPHIYTGCVVVPGQTIGFAGSSGYGKPGTQGKFAPHLHYGIYRDYGLGESPFNPYPLLKKWEKEARIKNKRN